MQLFLLDFDFDGVEAFAIDTDDGALRDEGVGVDLFDKAEDGEALVLAGKDAQHFHFLTSVPAVSVEDGDTVVELGADGVGNLLVFLREDEELHGGALAVVDEVEHEVFDDHGAESEHDHRGALEDGTEGGDEETGADDDEIDEDEHGAERHVVELVDGGGDDVAATGGAVVDEHDAEG